MDRRKYDWKDKLLSGEGPKTIKELHNEYFKELEDQDKRLQEEEPYDHRYSNRGPRGGSKVVYYEKKETPVFQGSLKKNFIFYFL